MAISVSSSTIIMSLNPRTSTDLSPYHCLSTLSFSSSLKFQPIRLVDISSSSRYRSLQVEAKKQTFNSFDDLLVDFYATWCGPCQFMVPVMEEVSAALNDKIKVVKIDTEMYPTIADKCKIQGLPTFIIFKDKEPFDSFEGVLGADQLIQRIETSLSVKQ